MDDLEKQFFANDSNDLSAEFFAEPVKEQAETNKRGANLAGAIRNVAQATPFIGTYADEAEGLIRSMVEPGGYETWRRNAEESAQGNIENTGYGRALNIGTNLAENALLTGLLRGKNLMPGISALQGAVEGFGRGSDIGERTSQALVGGGLGYVVPTALNRILPTKTVQKMMTEKLANGKDGLGKIIARSILQKTTPEDVIAREVPKGMRPDLWANVRRGSVGENVMRKVVQKQASDVVSMPYEEYIVKEVGGVAPKYASKLGRAMEKLKLDQLADDVVGEFDPRAVVMDAVNDVMKGAPQTTREAVGQAVSDAVAKRGVAKKLTTATIERPVSTGSGSIWNMARRLASPLRNAYNYGTMRALTVGTPNFVPGSLLERLSNRYTPDVVRGGLDALIEDYERRSLK